MNIDIHGTLIYEINDHRIYSYNMGRRIEYFMLNQFGHISQFLSLEAMYKVVDQLRESTCTNKSTNRTPNIFSNFSQKFFKFFLNFFEIFITSVIEGILDMGKGSNFF